MCGGYVLKQKKDWIQINTHRQLIFKMKLQMKAEILLLGMRDEGLQKNQKFYFYDKCNKKYFIHNTGRNRNTSHR